MPDGVNIPGGPSFIGLPQPPDVPCDPTGDGWRGPPGPPGPSGVGVFLPLVGGTMTGPIVLPSDPTTALQAASKHYVDQQTAVGTPPGGPFLALTGGTLTGNLTSHYATTYNGERATLTYSALNIAQTASGATSGQDWIGLNNVNITDTLGVNPGTNTLCSFQGQITGATLTITQPITGTPLYSFMGSISGTVLTCSPPLTGVTAGLTVNWSGGSNTVVSGGAQPTLNLAQNSGTVPLQAMTLIGPKAAEVLQWGSSPDNPYNAIIQSWSGTPDQWTLVAAPGDVVPQPMAIVKVAGPMQQAIALYWNHSYGGTGITGGRTGPRFQMTQIGPMPTHANYQNLLASHSIRYPSGGTDLWSGAAGTVWGMGLYYNFVKPTSAPGPTCYRAALALEIDYGCASGLSGTDASVASIGGLLLARWSTHQCVPAIWEGDFAFSIGQQASAVSDGAGGFLPARGAKFGIRFNSLSGVNPIDPANGRAIGWTFGGRAFNFDGTPGSSQNQGRHGVDWYNVDWTGTQFRGQGFSVVGSGGPFAAGAVQVGGGYLSATSSTVSLDTAGSVCTAIAGIASGGANLRQGLPLVHDDTGTVAIVTATNAGAATAVVLLANTGRAINGHLPNNPVQFRTMGPPTSFTNPGPTGPQLNLTWTAPTTLALQPSGGTTTVGGILNTGSIVSAGTARANIVLVGTTAAVGTEMLNVNGGFVMGGTVGAGQGGTIIVNQGTSPLTIDSGVTTLPSGFPNSGALRVIGAAAGYTSAEITGFGSSGAASLVLRNINGTPAVPIAQTNGQVIGSITALGFDGTVYTSQQAGWVVSASGAWTTAAHATYQSWYITKTGTTAYVEQMRLSQNGNLLLGTTIQADDAINNVQCNGNIKTTTFFTEGITNSITLTGSNQATALTLTTGLNVLTSVPATSGAMLPRGGVAGGCSPGTFVDIINTTTAAAKVYGFGAATIDGAAATTGVTLSGNARCRYWMTANSTWISTLLGAPSA